VTIAEFREFVEAGGYADESLWAPRSRAWLRENGALRPEGWDVADGRFTLRTMFETVPLERVSGWPVSVCWAEAEAYARWRGARLPTESELAAQYGVKQIGIFGSFARGQ